MAWIQTHLGERINPFNLDKDKVRIGDIAHALAYQCRFYGHTRRFYSVAEHCIIMAKQASFENKLWALMHDAAEAYLSDVSAPLKEQVYIAMPSGEMKRFAEVERLAMATIADCFGMREEQPSEVYRLDEQMLAMERIHVMDCQQSNWGIDAVPVNAEPMFLDPETAKNMFLTDFFVYEGRNRREQHQKMVQA